MRKLAQSKGGKCLSNEYSFCNQKLTWECAEGHTWENNYYNIQKGSWCRICKVKKKRRLTTFIEDCHKLAELKGGKCLSTQYINNKSKLKWQCAKGHIWDAPYNRIHQGHWCTECAIIKKKSIEDCHKLAELKGGKCLSTEYINNKSKLKWQCAKGHIWNSRYNNVHQGHWCRRCFFVEKKKCIEDCHKLAELKDGKCLSTEYISNNSILKWQCAKGHIWNSNYGNIQQGRWCPECDSSKYKSIEDCHKLAELKDGKCLSTEYINNKSVLKWQCCDGHIWDASYNRIQQGHWCLECANTKKKSIENCHHDQQQQDKKTNNDKKNIMKEKRKIITLQSCHELAESKGGKFLSPEYSVSGANYKWQCSNGHIWEAQHSAINSGRWCRQCGGRKKITLQSCHELAESKGGKFLSPAYSVSGAVYKWQCSIGHIFETQHSQVVGGRWCRQCALKKKNSMEKCHKIAESKGGKCLSTEFQNNYAKLMWECENGHTFSRTYDSIKRKNKWCLACENIERKNLITRTYEKTETNEEQEKPMGVFQMMDEWRKMSKNEDAVQRLLDYIIERKSEVNSQSNSINWGRYLALQEIESWMMFNFKFHDKAETQSEKHSVQDDEKVMFGKITETEMKKLDYDRDDKNLKFSKVVKKSGSNAYRSQNKMSQIARKASEIRKANEPWRDAFNRAKAIIDDITETQPEQIDIVEHIYVSQKTTDELKEINNQNIIQKVQNRLNELFKYKKID